MTTKPALQKIHVGILLTKEQGKCHYKKSEKNE
jgi:hypothetical protein